MAFAGDLTRWNGIHTARTLHPASAHAALRVDTSVVSFWSSKPIVVVEQKNIVWGTNVGVEQNISVDVRPVGLSPPPYCWGSEIDQCWGLIVIPGIDMRQSHLLTVNAIKPKSKSWGSYNSVIAYVYFQFTGTQTFIFVSNTLHSQQRLIGGKVRIREWVSVIECVRWRWRDLYAYPSLSWV